MRLLTHAALSACLLVIIGCDGGGSGGPATGGNQAAPSSRPAAAMVERSANAVRVGSLGAGRLTGQMVWTAAGDLVGKGDGGRWVRVSTSSGNVQPFSDLFLGDKGENAVGLAGAEVIYTTYERLKGITGFGAVPADGGAAGAVVATCPDLKTYRPLAARRVGGGWDLLLRKPLRTQDDEIYVATGGPNWQFTRVAGVPADHVFIAADPGWTRFVSRRARVGGAPILCDAAGTQLGILPASAEGALIQFAPDGKRLAIRNAPVSGGKYALLVAESADPANPRTLHSGTEWIGEMAFSPDGKHLAVTLQTDNPPNPPTSELRIFKVE